MGLLCVVAVAMASVLHVVVDVRPAHADTLSVSAAQTDKDHRTADGVVEACHSCAVVSFLVANQGAEHELIDRPIPAGRSLHFFSFTQSATAPPPKALT